MFKVSNSAFYILLLIFTKTFMQAQMHSQKGILPNAKVDSLKNKLKYANEDSNRVNTINNLAWIMQRSEPFKALDYAAQSLSLAEKIDFKPGISDAYQLLGSVKYNIGEYEKALEFYLKAIAVSEKIGDLKNVGTNNNSIGNIYAQQGDYERALEFYIKALKIKEKLGDKKGMASGYGNIGNIYYLKNNFGKAIEYYSRDLQIFTELGNKKGMADSYNNIGLVHAAKHNLSKALEFYQKDLEITKELGDKQGMADTYSNIGLIYNEKKEYEKALEFYLKSLLMREELNDKLGIADSYINIGILYLKQKHFYDARQYLTQALEIARKINAKPNVVTAYNWLSACDSATENYKSAYLNFKLFSRTKDSVINEESNATINELQTKYETESKQKQIELLNKDKEKQAAVSEEENKQQKIILSFVLCGLITAVGFALFIFRGYKQKQKANLTLAEKNEIIEEKNKDITDSIRYAKRIQEAILPPDELVKKYFPESFILYKPKDIVSGDFYWMEEQDGKIFFAVVDCTGHGVPGAFMSIVGSNILKQSVNEHKKIKPSEILDELNIGVSATLRQTFQDSPVKDGMDIALCCYDKQKNNLQFAGAFNPLWLVRNNELMETVADKFPIGIFVGEKIKKFSNNELSVKKGDTIYIFSDGYADQFGGINLTLGTENKVYGKKFMYKRLKEVMVSIQNKTMEEQKFILNKTIEDWKGKQEQIDDILIMGIRI